MTYECFKYSLWMFVGNISCRFVLDVYISNFLSDSPSFAASRKDMRDSRGAEVARLNDEAASTFQGTVACEGRHLPKKKSPSY